MAWGGITSKAKVGVFQRESLTAQKYISDILKDYVLSFTPYINNDFIFMHDNMRNVVTDLSWYMHPTALTS